MLLFPRSNSLEVPCPVPKSPTSMACYFSLPLPPTPNTTPVMFVSCHLPLFRSLPSSKSLNHPTVSLTSCSCSCFLVSHVWLITRCSWYYKYKKWIFMADERGIANHSYIIAHWRCDFSLQTFFPICQLYGTLQMKEAKFRLQGKELAQFRWGEGHNHNL